MTGNSMGAGVKALLSAAAMVGLLSGAAQAAPAGLLGFYEFTGGDLTDTSGLGSHGVANAGVGFVANGRAPGNAAATFAAVAGLSGFNVPININPASLPAMTFGAWVNIDPGAGPLAKFLSHDDGGFDRTIGVDTRGGGFSAFTGTGVLGGGPRVDNVWKHVAASYDGATVNLFVDGALAGTAADTTGGGFSALTVGSNPGFNEDFVGLMDDVFVFGRALNAGEIADIVNNGIDLGPPNAVPLPATAPLLGIALLTFALARRRRRG